MQSGFQLTALGHAAFLVERSGRRVLIDPWLTNPWAPAAEIDFTSLTALVVTHGHRDHLGEAVEIASTWNKPLVVIDDLHILLAARGARTTIGLNRGGSIEIDGVQITFTAAVHSSSFLEGETLIYAGEPCGVVLRIDGDCLYHAGDTALFGDMQYIHTLYRPRIALLPVGGTWVMEPEAAALAARLIKPDIVVPIHYPTVPDAPDRLQGALAETGLYPGIRVCGIQPGQTVTV